ncbi:MAG: aminoacyl-tRNA hydrolase [Aestuariivirgaceae bacterium]|nr:aminoacyl-tRNA hydrolase [Aestuariivirgaceae bacterium]
MRLMVGLGNPGPQYQGNRHNIGFMAVDEIVRRHGFSPWRKRFQGECAEGQIAGVKVLALKPATYMNESGRAVGEAMRFLKIAPEDVVVFHDELDLAAARVRVKLGGGNAGHNGLRSIDAHIGNNFQRVRMGIGHPGMKALVHAYVLHDFAKADKVWLEPLLDETARNADLLVEGRADQFQNRIALALKPVLDELDKKEQD